MLYIKPGCWMDAGRMNAKASTKTSISSVRIQVQSGWRTCTPMAGMSRESKGGSRLRRNGNPSRNTWMCMAAEEHEDGVGEEQHVDYTAAAIFLDKPLNFVWVSCVFYAGMLGVAIAAGKAFGFPVYEELMRLDGALAGLLYTVPPVVFLLAICEFEDKLPEFKKIRILLQQTILPAIRKMPMWGPAALAIGAGLGEEALFRALIQTGIINSLTGNLAPFVATGVGIGLASLLFGLSHAISPTYFWWATFAGGYLGIEYVLCGLPSAALTHALYDWIALVYMAQRWPYEPKVKVSELAGDDS